MKKLISIIAISTMSFVSMAQSPAKFTYQAVVRSASTALLANSTVGVRLSILQGTANGSVSYSETHSPTTNANGLFTLEVGGGTATIGTFAAINWTIGPYFLKSEIDATGGTNYDIVSTSQLLSVPYALHSSSAGSIDWSNVQNKPSMNSNTFSGSYTDLTNKPTIPASFSGSYLDLTDKPIIINNTFTGSYSDLTNKPIIPASFSGSYLDLIDKPVITNNTFTGSYSDLTNKPIIPASFSGSYLDLIDKPILTTLTGGTGVSISGTNQIVNTAPDRTVSITGINLAISGTYPAFTVTSGIPNGTIAGQMLYWNGTVWGNVKPGQDNQVLTYCKGVPTWLPSGSNCPVVIGDSYQGGIVAYILQSGDLGYDANVQHGLIAAPSDQSLGIQWRNGTNIATGATATSIGSGNSNTNTIVAAQGAGSYAAKLCADLTLGGYSDWFLPSRDELTQLYFNKIAIGGFSDERYWSSSEDGSFSAWYIIFNNGDTNSFGIKSFTYSVRAIRAF